MSAAPLDLPCREVVELVSEYLGHALTLEQRTQFDAHLETCPPCTTYLEQMKTVLSLASSLGKPASSEEVTQELKDLFERWHHEHS